ncbi:MAG: response regulator transcription factor [Flavobacteriales bacterium]|nr:response regulator transcription factor [Flavobacteriales bacterium]
MKKVLLVDDHKIIRDGIKAIFKPTDGIQIVGECEDGDEVLDFLKNHEVDVILMDINMKRLNGIEATELVKQDYPDVNVIALSMYNEEGFISRILKAGAIGYLLKNAGKQEIISAINSAAEGKSYFDKEVAEVMMSKFLRVDNGAKKAKNNQFLISIDDLTKREIEVIKLITEELTTQEISEKLFISPRTVDSHRRNLLQKIGVKNTAGLVKFALHYKIID